MRRPLEITLLSPPIISFLFFSLSFTSPIHLLKLIAGEVREKREKEWEGERKRASWPFHPFALPLHPFLHLSLPLWVGEGGNGKEMKRNGGRERDWWRDSSKWFLLSSRFSLPFLFLFLFLMVGSSLFWSLIMGFLETRPNDPTNPFSRVP